MDASLQGWGGTCGSRAVGGLWPAQQHRHINLLELDTVLQVLRRLAPLVHGRHVLVRSDNTTTVAYINCQGGVRSKALYLLAVDLWLWAAANLKSLRASHIAGHLNLGADLMSRGGPRRDEWSLHPLIVQRLWERFGRAEVDLFASKVNAKCPLWYSLSPWDNPPLGADAFAHAPWPRVLLYTFPPLGLILPLLGRLRLERASLILVAPDYVSARWRAELGAMAAGPPWPIPLWPDALSQRSPPVLGKRLLAWRLNGGDFPVGDYLQP